MKKQEKGITLVALVVTIIVLLILAGIAISLTIGNNGLFSRAQNAVNVWNEASKKEENEIDDFIGVFDNVVNEINGNKSDTVKKKITVSIVREWREDVEKVEIEVEKNEWTVSMVKKLKDFETSINSESEGLNAGIEFITAGNGYAYLELRNEIVKIGDAIDFNGEYIFHVS